MKRQARHLYEFGPFQIDPDERLLLREGKSVHLTMRAFDTLMVLIRGRGHLIEKSELMKTVWSDSFVEEGNLSVAISMLRKALGDDGNEHKYIETIAKRGYRFVGGVREAVKPEPDSTAPFREIKSLAVVPFGSTNSSPTRDYLCLGLTDAIITKLARNGNIVVRPTGAVLKYASAPADPLAVGREQGVDAILSGYIETFPDRVRVTAQLVRVGDECLLRADSFEESPQRIFALEDEMANEVASWLSTRRFGETTIRPARPATENPKAYQLYLEGRYFWNKRTEEGLRRSIEYFKHATTEDVQYAHAYAGLADSYVLLDSYGVEPAVQAYPLAKAAALKALQLNNSLAEPHASLGMVYFYCEWNWSEAEREFQRAIALNPKYVLAHSWYALNLGAMGRYEEALAQVGRAQELDPLSLEINTVVGRIHYFGRQFGQSIDAYRRVIDLDPHYARAHTRLGITYAAKGDFDDAIEQFETSRRLASLDPYLAGLMGYTYALSGSAREARKLLEELTQSPSERFVPASSVALIWIGLGKYDQALECLEKAYQGRSTEMVYAKTEPLLDPVRPDSRFTALLDQLGLHVNSIK